MDLRKNQMPDSADMGRLSSKIEVNFNLKPDFFFVPFYSLIHNIYLM